MTLFDTDSLTLDEKWAKCIRMRDFATEISNIFRGSLPQSPHAGEVLRRPSPHPAPSALRRFAPRSSVVRHMSRNGGIKSWQPYLISMIHRPLTISSAAWEGGQAPPLNHDGGHGRIAPPPMDPPMIEAKKTLPLWTSVHLILKVLQQKLSSK